MTVPSAAYCPSTHLVCTCRPPNLLLSSAMCFLFLVAGYLGIAASGVCSGLDSLLTTMHGLCPAAQAATAAALNPAYVQETCTRCAAASWCAALARR